MTIEVTTTDGGNSVELRISDRFDFSVHREFRSSYEDNGTPQSAFTIDLGATDYMDSSALGMLLVLREFAGGGSADISIQNCGPEIRKLLEIANYDKLFKINETVL